MGIKRKIDPITTAVPLAIVLVLCALFLIAPSESTKVLGDVRSFFEETIGVYYLMMGLGVFLVSLYIALSDIGRVHLGNEGEKPRYDFWAWGSMMFTAGLAADILFYSFCEWILYAGEPHIAELGTVQDWASTIPLFHWGPIPWSFYAVLAVCFGFMLHVRGVKKQKYSEACRAFLGKHTDGILGKLIDIVAVIALVSGTATTFGLATPLLTAAVNSLFGIPDSKELTIAILIIICLIYTASVLHDMKGIKLLAETCMYVFGALLVYVFVFGQNPTYIIETGFSAVGNLCQNFIGLSTWTDALRTTGFPQNWTIFYWAYWMVWCVAAPFFMGNISRGRTVKQVVLGAYVFGMGSTFISFIILGNYSLCLQMDGKLDVIKLYDSTGNLYQAIIEIIHTLPLPQAVLVLLIISMIAFYATSFDSITLVASAYSYKQIGEDEEAGNGMKLFWAILLILLPIALLFNESSMKNLQTVSMIAAFPMGLIIILIILSFFRDVQKKLEKQNKGKTNENVLEELGK